MVLAIDTYDREEREVRERIGYTEYSAFGTKTFDDFGFPTRMARDDQIFRFVDWYNQQDPQRLEPNLFFRDAALETNYTLDEVQLLTKLSQATYAITEKYCEKPIRVHFNHQGSVGLFRVTQAIADISGKEQLSVFEVGPGCGYMGAMIGFAGHNYCSYDVTQGYYIWQSRLHEHLFGNEFSEFVGNPEVRLDQRGRIAHIPWWVYMTLYRNCPIEADVVISNSNLGEMSYDCLRYVLQLSKQMLERSDISLFVFANPGACHMNMEILIWKELEKAGYERITEKNVYAFVPPGKTPPPGITEILEERIPLYDPSGLGKTVGVEDFVDFTDDDMGDEFYFNAFISGWREFTVPGRG